MIQLSYDEILTKIQEKSDVPLSEIEEKIKTKLDSLAGLISKEGAAHIVANEMGIRLIASTASRLQIKDIISGMRSVEVLGKVVAAYEVRSFTSGEREGKVGNFLLGDPTGKTRCVCWGDQAETVRKLEAGDVVLLRGGYVKENQGRSEVHLNEKSTIVVNPEGETVGDIPIAAGPIRKKIVDLGEHDSNAEVLGTVVQAFEPRFYEVCPECGKRARPQGDSFVCQTHGEVQPTYSYVMNFVLDDGSDTMRLVCFREQVQELLSQTHDQMLVFKDEPQKFDDVKQNLLGSIMKFRGRVKKNDMFDRLEFTAFAVDSKPDPTEELAHVGSSSSSESASVSTEDVVE